MHETPGEDATRPPPRWSDAFEQMERSGAPDEADARMREVLLEWNAPYGPRHRGGYAWIRHAIARFGGDRTVGAIRQGVANWSREPQTRRRHANFLMDALIDVGTPAAMMALVEMARVQDVPRVWARANNLIGHLARSKKQTAARFADEAVPRLGLDARGARVFDVGARRVRVVFGVDMEPHCFDHGTGERLRAEDAFSADHAEWEHAREVLAYTLEAQDTRLEDAMVTERRWTQSAWRRVFLEHPVMRTYAQRQVWGLFDRSGRLVVTFRATEELELVGVDDEPVAMPPGAEVGIAHPLHMHPGLRAAWSQSFGDYEISSPVEQLGRATYGRDAERFVGEAFEPGAFRAQMMHDLWRHDPSSHHKIALRRDFGRGVHVALMLDPGFQSWREMGRPQRVTSIKVRGGDGERERIAWSEAARSLVRVRARA